MRRFASICFRLAATGLTVGAVGLAFVTLAPTQHPDSAPTLEVPDSNADIFTMAFGERTSTQKFQSALDRLGHEKPRVYDLNGNTVMFSTNTRRGSIGDAVQDYLQAFADEDLNPHVFDPYVKDGSDDHKAMLEAAVNGGIIPWTIDDSYMAMGGAVMDVAHGDDDDLSVRLQQQAGEVDELLDRLEWAVERCSDDPAAIARAMEAPKPVQMLYGTSNRSTSELCSGSAAPGSCDTVMYHQQHNAKRYAALVEVIEAQGLTSCSAVREGVSAFAGMRVDDFTRRIKAFRSIEAWHDAPGNVTHITATWSDESFDMTKTQPTRFGAFADTDAARKVPACPGCRRTWAFGGTGDERGYSSNILLSPSNIALTADFYVNALTNEGWEIPESDVVADEIARIHGVQKTDSRWLRFARGNEHLAIHLEADAVGRTIVRTSIAP